MPRETYAHQVVDLSLLEGCTLPYAGEGGDVRVLSTVGPGLEDDAMVVFDGDQVVDQLEIVDVVDAGHAGQEVQSKGRSVVAIAGHVGQVIGLEQNVAPLGILNGTRKLLLYLLGKLLDIQLCCHWVLALLLGYAVFLDLFLELHQPV